MTPLELEANMPSKRPSHMLWNYALYTGEALYKAAIPLIIGIALRTFSKLLSQVSTAYGVGLFFGRLIGNIAHLKIPKQRSFSIMFRINLAALAAITLLAPQFSIAAGFGSGFFHGLFMTPREVAKQQEKKKDGSDTMTLKVPD